MNNKKFAIISIAIVLVASVSLCWMYGCITFQPSKSSDLDSAFQSGKSPDLDSTQATLTDIAYKVKGHYSTAGKSFGPDFNEDEYIALVESVYPDRERAAAIIQGFIIKARGLGDYFSVMLCDKQSGKKVMEDISCTVRIVELPPAAPAGPCQFEDDWKAVCGLGG